jgi:negative regulator of sigma-B (phosphoserine phosphatase)
MGALSAMSAHDVAPFDYAVAARGLEGPVSGDHFVAKPNARGMLVAVIDGLGHGRAAAQAAAAAATVLEAQPDEPLLRLVKRCHEALGTNARGVAMTLTALDAGKCELDWVAVGNVDAVLLRLGEDGLREKTYVLARGGIVGHRLPPLRSTTLPLLPGDLIILATDGIRAGFERSIELAAPPQQIADRILAQHGKGTDDALVLVGRWGAAPAARSRS